MGAKLTDYINTTNHKIIVERLERQLSSAILIEDTSHTSGTYKHKGLQHQIHR